MSPSPPEVDPVETRVRPVVVEEEPTGAPLRATEANLGWGRVVDRVRRVKPAVASVLEHGKIVRFGPEAVEIAYARNTFYWDAARDPELRLLIDQALADQFGVKVSFVVAPLDAAGSEDAVASLAELAAAKRRERVREIKNAALAHPAVRGAIDILGGEVSEVKPLARELDD